MPEGDARRDQIKHLEWAIESRARNQRSCLQLLKLLETHEKHWTTRDASPIAQDLIALAFSLWRAAFLADKTGRRTEVFKDGKSFLETVIRDNAISYPQDKKAQEWTFNFYTRNARHTIEHLSRLRPHLVPEYQRATRKPKERWDYCQELLDTTLTNFAGAMAEIVADADKRRLKRETKAKKKQQRRTVRLLTEADRKTGNKPATE